MMPALTTIGFDADDTLWHNERFFQMTQARFRRLLADYAAPAHLDARLLAAERRNLGHYGYGVKGFTLSMIETAIEVTEARVPADVIGEIVAVGREMLRHPIELMPHAVEVLKDLAQDYRIILITKGDLLDQERKLAQSGLGEMFAAVEIVSDKTAATYRRAFARHGDGAARAMMVGDSMRSDVVAAIRAGCWGVHVPHGTAWALEEDTAPLNAPRYHALPDLGALPALVARLSG